MKLLMKVLLWAILFTVLMLFFYCAGAITADAAYDSSTVITVLTEEGTVSMTMAGYLPGAIAAEMPVSFGAEALKAQAVAIRTYVLSSTSHEEADVCTDSTCCLAYLDEEAMRELWGDEYDEELAAVTEAATETDGQILLYDGQAIQAVFHASSAGLTEDAGNVWSSLPYLVSVTSPETPDNVPGLLSAVYVSADTFLDTLGLTPEDPDDPSQWLEDTILDGTGRVQTLILCGEEFSGTYIRSAFGLKSTAFTVYWDGTQFVFYVAGNGHGVGMSQYGAMLLAEEGMDYEEILAHYYPGTELATIDAMDT